MRSGAILAAKMAYNIAVKETIQEALITTAKDAGIGVLLKIAATAVAGPLGELTGELTGTAASFFGIGAEATVEAVLSPITTNTIKEATEGVVSTMIA